MQTYHLIFPISFSYLVQTISRTSLQAPEQKEAPPYFTSTAALSQRNNVSCSLLFEDCPKRRIQTAGIVYFYDCFRHGVRVSRFRGTSAFIFRLRKPVAFYSWAIVYEIILRKNNAYLRDLKGIGNEIIENPAGDWKNHSCQGRIKSNKWLIKSFHELIKIISLRKISWRTMVYEGN